MPKSPSTAGNGSWSVHLAVIALVWAGWLYLMVDGGRWGLFADNWFMSVTMVLGSFIAGATSEGGGAVAFPVMTLAFDIAPHVARDFSLMIQSVGMVAAAIVIVAMGVAVEWRAIVFAGLGGAVGIVIGLDVIAPLLTPSFTKTFFVALWLSFGFGLYWINRDRAREVYHRIAGFRPKHGLFLFIVGIAGGMVSGITGSGLDIVTFSLLVLVFSLNEKVATPTSVVIMATNTVVGFFWREAAGAGVAAEAWNYWYVCVPIVVIGAPLGARFIRNRSRLFVAGFLYLSIVAQYLGALFVIPQTPALLAFNAAVLGAGVFFFWQLARYGQRRVLRLEAGR
jgi:uncharacterized membrane protein YfcA